MSEHPLWDYYTMVENLMAKVYVGPDLLLHCAIGVTGECFELIEAQTQKEMVEELGDLCFYMEGFSVWIDRFHPLIDRAYDGMFGQGYEELSESSIAGLKFDMLRSCISILDLAKKHWAYGQPVKDRELMNSLIDLRTLRNYMYRWLGVSHEEVRAANMRKLALRYPSGKFTTEHSAARLDKTGEKK